MEQLQDLARSSARALQSLFVSAVVAAALTGCATTYRGPGDLHIGSAQAKAPVTRDSEPPPQARGPTSDWDGQTAPGRGEVPLKFDWPVERARLSRGFLFGRKAHWGLDLADHKGSPILAAERGVVIYAGRGFHGYGRLVVVEHDNRWATLYAHLDRILVKEGQSIGQGQKLGLMGRTGHATGVHLHFELRKDRQPVNPLAYLPPGF